MDINGFREPQSPWFFTQPPTMLVDIRNSQQIPEKPNTSVPTQDNRYPGWAARMNDGRLVTDYRPRCELKVPTGSQFATRMFMQRNAESIMSQARQRQVNNTGASLSYYASSEMPPEDYVRCTKTRCDFMPGNPDGVGTSRIESVPELFGTFGQKMPAIVATYEPPLTQVQEGGRNTRRGAIVGR
jgi:hypothetical protein